MVFGYDKEIASKVAELLVWAAGFTWPDLEWGAVCIIAVFDVQTLVA